MPPGDSARTPPSLLPEHEGAHGLVVRGIEAVESSRAQLSAVEKSVDGLRIDVAESHRRAVVVETILARIAAAEEERTRIQREEVVRREAWATRLWSTPAIQLLITALVFGVLNLVGLRWAVERAVEAAPTHQGPTP